RLTRRVGSYWPTGTETCKLPPTIRSCLYDANSCSDIAGAPKKLTDTRNRASPSPSTSRWTDSPLKFAVPESQVNGAIASTFADMPARSNTREYARTAFDVLTCGFVTGTAGSNDRP